VSDSRRYPVGPELRSPGRVNLRVWAPDHDEVQAEVDGERVTLTREGSGHFSADVDATAGSRYGFIVPGGDRVYPDPASRFLPDGPDGLSAVVDLDAYTWHDEQWPGVTLPGQVLYELHIGTWTDEGTWRAAATLLPELRALGVTVVQMMPIAEFAGRFGWGYDGVQWFAPTRCYGAPADLQHFVDTAHQLGLGVILDVVYNHLGPTGNYLSVFDRRWQSRRHRSEWGGAPNFDDEGAAGLRELVLANVSYWVREFHFDGFRVDAAQQIVDESSDHILAALTRAARAAATPRSIIVVAEHEPQHSALLRPPEVGGCGLDALFHEDFHHSCRVALTGMRDGYLSNYRGTSDEWLAAAQLGFLYQGQYYPWQSAPRGAPAWDMAPAQTICFLENHDQVANSAAGARLIDLTSEAWWRALSTLLLWGPWTPLLFQGQEDGGGTPFRYFADHEPTLQAEVLRGRLTFLAQFARFAGGAVLNTASDSIGADVFEACRLHRDDPRRERCRRLYTDLLTWRRHDPALGPHARHLIGATAGDRTLILRFRPGAPVDERLLAVNLDADLDLAARSHPIVAPPDGCHWQTAWCSEEARYGGSGAAVSDPPRHLIATGHAATLFTPVPRR